MNILFPSNPLQPKSVERSFGYEAAAAKEAGFHIGRIDLEIILGGEVKIANVAERAEVFYRGWLVKPEQYRAIEADIRERLHGRLIPGAAHYEQAYHLPAWYGLLPEGTTPRSIWLPPDTDLSNLDIVADLLAEAARSRGWRSAIVKDYVKSAKHRWFDACFIRDVRDRDEVKRVVRNFLDVVREGLVGSLVFREFVEFRRIGTHPKIGLPLINEWRGFLCHGKVIYLAPYWSNGDYGKGGQPEKAEVERLAAPLREHPFCAVDIAQTDAGNEWKVIEFNPAGATGIPEGGNVRDFYQALRRACGTEG